MAKSRAQQAAIAISMKKAGKKPKLKKKGGVSDTITVSSKDQATAKKKLQNKFNGKIPKNAVLTYDKTTGKYTYTVPPSIPKVDQKREGGYPKSDKNDFMKRMGYYQGGGLAAPPMYGANTMPGSPETASITYQEADQARLKALEDELKEAQESTKFQDEAEAEVQKQASTISGIEQGLSQGVKGLDKLGVFDKLKQKGIEKAADKTKDLLAQKTLESVGQTTGQKGAELVTSTVLPEQGAKLLTQPVTGSFTQELAAKGAQKAAEVSSGVTSGAGSVAGGAGGSAAGAAGAGIGMGGVGAIASLAGEGIKMASDDQDATTMNVGETIGSGLSGIGTGIGTAVTTAALLGSSLGPVGTAAGVVGGALYGLGKGLITRGKARKEEKKAEQKKQKQLSDIRSKSRLEALKSKQYSGFDFGSDIRQSGGFPKMPAAYLKQIQDLNAQAPKQGVIKATDESLSNKLYQTSQKIKHFNVGPGGPPQDKDGNAVPNPVTSLLGSFSGVTPAMEIAQSTKNFRAAPSKETAMDLALNTIGSVPLGGKVLGATAKYGPKVLTYADDAVKAFQAVPAVNRGYKALKGKKFVEALDIAEDLPPIPFINQMGGYYQTGGIKLPGGVAKPIPGSDAIEFKGRSHAEGGIMVDPMTEVEGDETMDQVTMKKGGKSDYFFSQHLKLGGKSFAQRHKDILQNGGSQRDIDALAKLQEKKAGRNPNTVKLGAGGYYQFGGKYPVDEFGDPFSTDLNMNQIPDFPEDVSVYNIPGGDVQFYPGTTIPIQTADDFEYAETVTDDTKKDDKKNNKKDNKKDDKKQSTNTTKNEEREEVNFTPMPLIPAGPIPLPESEIELATIPVDENGNPIVSEEDQNIINKANSGADLTDFEEKALKRLRRDVPGLAIGAGLAQLIAPAYAFFKKDRVAEQMGAPGRIKAPTLDRVSYNTERAANAADNRAMNRFIETSGIGPAGIIAKMSAYRRKQEGDLKIAAQESRVNTQIANQEAQLAQQANIRNVANAMQADQINTQLREAQLAANENRRLEAIDAFTERTAGLAGDLMSYKATERLARATGDFGIYERDRLRNFLKNRINPRTGKAYTNADIAEIFNKRFAQPTATEDDKKDDKKEKQ